MDPKGSGQAPPHWLDRLDDTRHSTMKARGSNIWFAPAARRNALAPTILLLVCGLYVVTLFFSQCATYFDRTNHRLVHATRRNIELVTMYPGGRALTVRQKTAVVLFSFTRTKYLMKSAMSLAANDLSAVDVIVMQDVPPPPRGFWGMFNDATGPDGKEALYRTAALDNPGYLRQVLPQAEIYVAKFNIGIAIAHQEAMKKVFVDGDYDAVIFLEDDTVLSHDFIENMLHMIEYTEQYPAMATAFGGYKNFDFEHPPLLMSNLPDAAFPGFSKDTLHVHSTSSLNKAGSGGPASPPCDFVVHPLKYDVGSNIGGSNWWAWSLTRKKWSRMWECQKDAYAQTGLDHLFYTQRHSSAIKEWMGKMGCPTQHGSQDHLRSCCFKDAKMTEKLRPVKRMTVPIGKSGGLHESPENFKLKGYDDKTMDFENGVYHTPIDESNVCYVQR